MKAFSRNCKVDVPELNLELDLFFLHLEMEAWILESERDWTPTKDRFTVSIILMVQNITRTRTITPAARKILVTVLTALGFHDYIRGLLPTSKDVKDHRLSFHFIKLIDSNSTILYPFMKITEHPVVWQLRLFGDYMDRSMDSLPDPRVSFEADAWQRRVLDGIDQNKSLLVVGKPLPYFLSSYDMFSQPSPFSPNQCREDIHILLCYGKGFKGIRPWGSSLYCTNEGPRVTDSS
jgi:hypothetical protein